MTAGIVRGIWIAPAARKPLGSVDEVRAVPGSGLEGDRYFLARGSFSRWPGEGRAVSLIEEETLEALRREHGIDLGNGRSRRNLVTAGVELANLKDCMFRIGTAVLRGVRPCAPCRYLEHVTQAGVFEALKGRGGFRADVIQEGIIRVGNLVELIESSDKISHPS